MDQDIVIFIKYAQTSAWPIYKRLTMPYVNIKVTNENVTAKQKQALIKGATELLQNVLNKNSATTVVIIDEIDTDNWGIAGEQVTQRRLRGD